MPRSDLLQFYGKEIKDVYVVGILAEDEKFYKFAVTIHIGYVNIQGEFYSLR
ncbi:MAG: hypothetical protein ACM3VZ_14955 [Acidobacteriota bacterium]